MKDIAFKIQNINNKPDCFYLYVDLIQNNLKEILDV